MTQQLFSQMRKLKGMTPWMLGAAMVLSTSMGAFAQEQTDCTTQEGYSTCAADLEILGGIGGPYEWEEDDHTQISEDMLKDAEEASNDMQILPSAETCGSANQIVLLCVEVPLL